ncbi:hypothetical protein [Lentzea sp. NPDC003310]|uniref:hypothetical protein n=1 Tax=Lentzea sp. NPDC003310 TaxID=3154447 RepID=UPI00339FDEB0
MTGGEPDRRLELVFSESLRALGYQQGALDNLRSRVTLLLAGAALVSSSFVGTALQGPHWGVAAVVAITAMTGVLVLALVVCAPVWRWTFLSSASRLLRAVDLGHDLDSMRRHLATDFEQWLTDNERKLRKLQWCFVAGLVLLLVEVAAWCVQLAQVKGWP